MSSDSSPTELILLGTGTSGSVPIVGCLTVDHPTCPTCTSPLPQNTRFNTSGLVRVGDKNILIDCGKTFYTSALRWFPKYKIRKIDALLLTHAHADAYFGLDDLRSWTLGGFVQPWIDVYCSAATLREIERTFPYLVNKAFATGGGDVADFKWHVFDEHKSFTIPTCDDVEVVPLPVEHGLNLDRKSPYMSLGFRFGPFSYISDCSAIPETTTELLRGTQVLVIDGLKWGPHASHFSIQQAREYVRDTFDQAERPQATWLTGFSHQVEHVHATHECMMWGAENKMNVAPGWDGLRIGLQGQNLDAI